MGNGADLSTSRSTPVIDFTSADFESMKTDMKSFAQAKYPDRWTDYNETQPGVIQLDITAYLGDKLTYMLNSHIRELYAGTVMRRQNLVNIGKPFSYEPKAAECATVTERFTLDAGGVYPFTIYKTNVVSNEADGDNQVFYQPSVDTVVASYPGVGYVDIVCIEGELFVNQLIGVSGNQPNQRWQFPQQGVVKSSISLTVGGAGWSPITNWSTQSSVSQVYKIVQTDDGNTFAVFGDGVFGAIPANGAEIRATFRIGGGRRGNLGKDTIKRKVNVPQQVLTVTNPASANGGDDAASMKEAREGIPATISTLERAVTEDDHEKLAKQVAGVAKARAAAGIPAGSNRVRVWIAPSGGGQPTSLLKNSVSTFLKTKKMVGKRIELAGAIYKDVRFHVLLHVNENFRAADVNQATRNGLLNTTGTGLLNFAQLDFGGRSITADGNEELLLGQTRLQSYFDDLKKAGLDRAEILQLDVVPAARARDSGNSGDGTVSNIVVTSRQRRREFFIELVSSAQYRVYERIVGRVSALADTDLVDDEKDFSLEGISSYAGWLLAPDRNSVSTVAVGSASEQTISATGLGGVSLFTLTQVGQEYYLYNPVVQLVNVGSEYVSSDENVRFTVVAGASPFVSGDSFTLDVFPHVSDIRLKDDEYPEFLDANLTTRTSGGARV